MKNTQRLLTWILVAVMIVVSTVALVACVDKPEPTELTELTLPKLKDNQMAVIIKNGDNDYTSYVVTLGKAGTDATTGEGVIDYLCAEVGLEVIWEDSTYGKYLTAIGGAKVVKANEYVMIMTSVEKDKGNWAGVDTYVVDGVSIVYSQVGISEMSVEAGAIIYFEIATF
ncbi:MAG: hypothetical protein J1G02_05235 [Clostridiales bacterium]|nr:hypothetical protein [Clostridiales bacterium]